MPTGLAGATARHCQAILRLDGSRAKEGAAHAAKIVAAKIAILVINQSLSGGFGGNDRFALRSQRMVIRQGALERPLPCETTLISEGYCRAECPRRVLLLPVGSGALVMTAQTSLQAWKADIHRFAAKIREFGALGRQCVRRYGVSHAAYSQVRDGRFGNLP